MAQEPTPVPRLYDEGEYVGWSRLVDGGDHPHRGGAPPRDRRRGLRRHPHVPRWGRPHPPPRPRSRRPRPSSATAPGHDRRRPDPRSAPRPRSRRPPKKRGRRGASRDRRAGGPTYRVVWAVSVASSVARWRRCGPAASTSRHGTSLEEALIRADVGVSTADALLEELKAKVASKEISGGTDLLAALGTSIRQLLETLGAAHPALRRLGRSARRLARRGCERGG